MKIQGIEFSKDEIEDFQKRFLGSPAASAVGRILNSVVQGASETLECLGVGVDSLRHAQGQVSAVRKFDEVTTALGVFDLEGDEDTGEDENETEEVIDVGY